MINKIKRFFLKSKKTSLDRSNLFILKTTSLSIVQVGHCKSVYSRSPTEVDEKGLVSPDCEDAVSSQLVVVFPWFGNRLRQKLSVQSLGI